jgi:hypothetical protein
MSEMIREMVKGLGIAELLDTIGAVNERIAQLKREAVKPEESEPRTPRLRPKLPAGEWPRADELSLLAFNTPGETLKEIAELPPDDPDRKLFVYSRAGWSCWECARAANVDRAILAIVADSTECYDSFRMPHADEDLWELPAALFPAQIALLDFCIKRAEYGKQCLHVLLEVLSRIGAICHATACKDKGFMTEEDAAEFADVLGEHFAAFLELVQSTPAPMIVESNGELASAT